MNIVTALYREDCAGDTDEKNNLFPYCWHRVEKVVKEGKYKVFRILIVDKAEANATITTISVRSWKNKLITYDEVELKGLNLPAASLSFLVEVGLPNEDILKQNGVHHTSVRVFIFKKPSLKMKNISRLENLQTWTFISISKAEVQKYYKPKALMENSFWDQYLFPYEIGFYKLAVLNFIVDFTSKANRLPEKAVKLSAERLNSVFLI